MTTQRSDWDKTINFKKKKPLGWEYSSVVESLACAFKRKKNTISKSQELMNLKHAVWHTFKEALAYRPPLLKGTIPHHLVYKVRKASQVCLAYLESSLQAL